MAFVWNQEAADAAEASESKYGPLPPGEYRVMINRCQDKETQAGNGNMRAFEFEVIEGLMTGRKLWENANYDNPNSFAMEMGWRTIVGVTKACFGEAKAIEAEEYEGKVMRVVVGIDTKDKQKNRIKKYLPDGPVVAPKVVAPKADDDFPF